MIDKGKLCNILVQFISFYNCFHLKIKNNFFFFLLLAVYPSNVCIRRSVVLYFRGRCEPVRITYRNLRPKVRSAIAVPRCKYRPCDYLIGCGLWKPVPTCEEEEERVARGWHLTWLRCYLFGFVYTGQGFRVNIPSSICQSSVSLSVETRMCGSWPIFS